MQENKKTNGPVILLISLLFLFLSFFIKEKEKERSESSTAAISFFAANTSGLNAIISQATSTPEINISWISKITGNSAFQDCILNREIIHNRQVFINFSRYRLNFLSTNPITGITFLQKVPEQEKEDDTLPVA